MSSQIQKFIELLAPTSLSDRHRFFPGQLEIEVTDGRRRLIVPTDEVKFYGDKIWIGPVDGKGEAFALTSVCAVHWHPNEGHRERVEPPRDPRIQAPSSSELGVDEFVGEPLAEAVAAFERGVIAAAMQRSENNKSQVAKDLGISRSNLIAKCQRYGIG